MLSQLSHNEYVPHETLSQFLEKNNGPRGKRMYNFGNQPDKEDKKQLLHDYLKIVQDREKERNQLREKDLQQQKKDL